MSEIDPVILEIRAEMGRYRADLRQQATDTERHLGRMGRDVQKLEKQMLRSSTAISGSFRTLGATLGTYFTGRELTGMIDSFTRLQNNLRVAGLEGENLAKVQTSLLDISTRYGASVEGLSGVFLKASLAQKELGASTSDIIKLNEIIAASLKVTGTSAQEAQGALLQLGQALGSGVVRAEEFNSILEGALPLAQAAARGLDGYGGSVAKLRAAVADGKITSQQFFEGVLKGGVQTLADAEKATLTLSGAFEALTSRLTVYIGESAKANGVTGALAGGLMLLADNLATVIEALAVIAIAFSGRFVAGALAGGTALRTVAAYASIATTSLAGTALAARSAGAALLAAFGGPVGLAIIAVVAALALAYARTDDLSRASETLRRSHDAVSRGSENARNAIDRLAASYGKAREEALKLVEAQRKIAAAQVAKSDLELISAEQGAREAAKMQGRYSGAFQAQAATEVRVAEANAKKARATLTAIEAALSAPPINAPASTVPTGSGTKPKAGPKAPKGRTDELAARAAQDLYNLEIEHLRAQAQLTTNADERADLESEILKRERDAREADIAAALKSGDLTEAQATAQRDILDKLYGRRDAEGRNEEIVVEAQKSLYGEQIARELRLQDFQDEHDLAEARQRAATAALRNQYDLATTDEDRRRIALQILDAEDAYLRSKLQAVKDNKDLSDAVRKQAEIELDALNSSAADRRALVERANQGALGRYVDSISDTKARTEEAVVRELQAVNDGITDALTSQLGIKNKFVKDLFSIFLDQVIFRPLAEALRSQSGGGGGGLFGSILSFASSIFGGGGGFTGDGAPGNAGGMDLRGFRAGGGPVSAGSLYRINENASAGNPEYFRPAVNGDIIPLGRMNQMAAQGGTGQTGIATVRLELAGDIDARIARVSGPVAVEVVRASAPTIIEGAVGETFRRSGRPKM